MLYIYETTEKYEAAIYRLDEGVLWNAENGEWYDGDRHTTSLPIYYRELAEQALKKQHTVTTYEFDELSPESREHAIETLWDINVAWRNWWEWIYEDAESVGLKIEEFDLSYPYHYCRGDLIDSARDTANKIIQEHGATCETYQTAQGFLAELDRFIETAEKDEYGELYLLSDEQKVEDIELWFLRAILEDYRILLQREYDYQTSEEAIIETIRVNACEFTENGELY